MIEFIFGVLATLSAEFLLAHSYIWMSGKGSTLTAVKTAVTASTADVRGASGVARTVVHEVEDFVKRAHLGGSTPVPTVVGVGNLSSPGVSPSTT